MAAVQYLNTVAYRGRSPSATRSPCLIHKVLVEFDNEIYLGCVGLLIARLYGYGNSGNDGDGSKSCVVTVLRVSWTSSVNVILFISC